jgi:hypothetical protein
VPEPEGFAGAGSVAKSSGRDQRTVLSTQSDLVPSPAAQRTGDIADEGHVVPPPSGQQVASSADGVNSPADGQAPEFFSEVDADQLDQVLLENFLSSRPIKRFRAVTVNSDAFRTVIRDVSQDAEVRVHLFGDVELPISTIERAGIRRWTVFRARNVDRQNLKRARRFHTTNGGSSRYAGCFLSLELWRVQNPKFWQSGYHIIWQRHPGVSVDTD